MRYRGHCSAHLSVKPRETFVHTAPKVQSLNEYREVSMRLRSTRATRSSDGASRQPWVETRSANHHSHSSSVSQAECLSQEQDASGPSRSKMRKKGQISMRRIYEGVLEEFAPKSRTKRSLAEDDATGEDSHGGKTV